MTEKNPLASTGLTVAANVKRLREEKNLTYAELSRKLDAVGRPIATLGLSRVEDGKRRVDADDLVALAVALDASPITLLMPNTAAADDTVQSTVSSSGLSAKDLWDWLRADRPLASHDPDRRVWLRFITEAAPLWRGLEIVEGLREIKRIDRLAADADLDGEPGRVARDELKRMAAQHGDD